MQICFLTPLFVRFVSFFFYLAGTYEIVVKLSHSLANKQTKEGIMEAGKYFFFELLNKQQNKKEKKQNHIKSKTKQDKF